MSKYHFPHTEMLKYRVSFCVMLAGRRDGKSCGIHFMENAVDCIPPKSIYWSYNTSCDSIWRRAFRRWCWMRSQGWSPNLIGLVAIYEDKENSLPHSQWGEARWVRSEKAAICSPRSKPSLGHHRPCWHLSLRLLASTTVRKYMSIAYAPSLWHFVLTPKPTNWRHTGQPGSLWPGFWCL